MFIGDFAGIPIDQEFPAIAMYKYRLGRVNMDRLDFRKFTLSIDVVDILSNDYYITKIHYYISEIINNKMKNEISTYSTVSELGG